MKKEILSLLACPKCKEGIEEKEDFLLCNKCGLAFPILEGSIPDMLVEDAISIQKAKKIKFKHKFEL